MSSVLRTKIQSALALLPMGNALRIAALFDEVREDQHRIEAEKHERKDAYIAKLKDRMRQNGIQIPEMEDER